MFECPTAYASAAPRHRLAMECPEGKLYDVGRGINAASAKGRALCN